MIYKKDKTNGESLKDYYKIQIDTGNYLTGVLGCLRLDDMQEFYVNEFEKAISLRVIDSHWMNHISTMSHLREGVGLRGYANENPLQAYTIEGFDMFDAMLNKINQEKKQLFSSYLLL